MKNILNCLFLLFLLSFTFACKRDKAPVEQPPMPKPIMEKPKPKAAEPEDIYVWLDRVYIRPTASNKIKSIGRAEKDQALKWTGKVSDEEDTFVFRGVAYQEPWYEVALDDGRKGWVFGGAIRREGEEKGNPPFDEMRLEFDHFGKYYLPEWVKGETTEIHDEIDAVTETYRKGNHILEITKSERGEFGYEHTYRLFNRDKKLLRERELRFEIDGSYKELVEVVKDYIRNPPVEFMRSQLMEKHYIRMNSRPLIVRGEWEESELKDEALEDEEDY